MIPLRRIDLPKFGALAVLANTGPARRREDLVREAKVAGMVNLPARGFDSNAAWLEIALTATDLVAPSR